MSVGRLFRLVSKQPANKSIHNVRMVLILKNEQEGERERESTAPRQAQLGWNSQRAAWYENRSSTFGYGLASRDGRQECGGGGNIEEMRSPPSGVVISWRITGEIPTAHYSLSLSRLAVVACSHSFSARNPSSSSSYFFIKIAVRRSHVQCGP